VRYIDPEIDNKSADNKGLLSRFIFWGGGNDKQKQEQYRVLVRDAGERAEVNVLNKEGVREQSATANRILTLLYEQLR
jgi:outer membrane protein assembly factor BamC